MFGNTSDTERPALEMLGLLRVRIVDVLQDTSEKYVRDKEIETEMRAGASV